MKKVNDTYYDLLKVAQGSNIAEIVAAYHCVKNAFSKDSLATYSLFTAEEIQIELGRLEEAYLTLSNVDKKREYDRLLALKGTSPETVVSVEPAGAAPPVPEPAEESAQPVYIPEEVNGLYLRQIRIQKGLSLDDVSRITKIPLKFLKSIEEEDVLKLPARVYVQGFIKNVAVLYKLEPKTTAAHYLNSIDSRTKEIWKE